jgi:hypothetical protein
VSLRQAATFALFATADLKNKPLTLTDVEGLLGQLDLGHTYSTLLMPTRRAKQNLGWLRKECDRDDERRNYIRLTKRGRKLAESLVETLR